MFTSSLATLDLIVVVISGLLLVIGEKVIRVRAAVGTVQQR